MSSNNDFGPIIATMESRYIEAQKIADAKLAALNVIRQEAGLPPRPPGIDAAASESGGAVLTQIKRDTFYGKKQMTAIREYLEMRRAQGDGPATPREILDALKAGGYQFETKSDEIAQIGVRALLRKANTVFHKLPGTGSYGLLAWYPNAKPNRDDSDDSPPRKKTKLRRPPKRVRPRPVSMAKKPEPEMEMRQEGDQQVSPSAQLLLRQVT